MDQISLDQPYKVSGIYSQIIIFDFDFLAKLLDVLYFLDIFFLLSYSYFSNSLFGQLYFTDILMLEIMLYFTFCCEK